MPSLPLHTVQARSGYATCAGYEIHYMDWQPAAAPRMPVVVAWHGLARTGRDMDALAAHLAGRGYRVVCPDMLGRGLSQWSQAPRDEYRLRFYARIAAEFFDALRIERAHWIGTSMRGAIGTVCAGGIFEPALARRIVSLLLNDNAPELAQTALDRIKAYAGAPPAFDRVSELEAFFRQVYRPYGWLSDAQWRLLTETSTRRLPDGRVTPHYDPQMVRQFTDHVDDYRIWEHYERLRIPVLCLRGAESDLVLPEVIEQMRRRGPGAAGRLQVLEVPSCGHAPALNVPEQLEPIEGFIRAGGAA